MYRRLRRRCMLDYCANPTGVSNSVHVTNVTPHTSQHQPNIQPPGVRTRKDIAVPITPSDRANSHALEPLSSFFTEQGVVQMLSIPNIPSSWHFYLISLGAMLALAGLDFIGAVFAKEWTESHRTEFLLAGFASFAVLFAVYAFSLQYAELSIVTFGWIVFLQVGLVVLDTVRYGVQFPRGKWIAIGVILLLQAYLVLAPNGESSGVAS